MNELQNKAIAKLDAEMEKEKRNHAIAVIGEYLINLITARPEIAEKLADSKNTLAGAYEAMRTEARKKMYNKGITEAGLSAGGRYGSAE